MVGEECSRSLRLLVARYRACPLPGLPEGLQSISPRMDYTPPALITLIVTDIGILTPSAVSDELIKLYC